MDRCIAERIEDAPVVCGTNETLRLYRVYCRAEDGLDVIAETIEGRSQWNCDGSDQPERPVTALNFRSSSPIT
jgi:hypothetical protein